MLFKQSSVSRGNRQIIIWKMLSTPSSQQFHLYVKTPFFINLSPPVRLLDTEVKWTISHWIAAIFCHSYTNWHNHSTENSCKRTHNYATTGRTSNLQRQRDNYRNNNHFSDRSTQNYGCKVLVPAEAQSTLHLKDVILKSLVVSSHSWLWPV